MVSHWALFAGTLFFQIKVQLDVPPGPVLLCDQQHCWTLQFSVNRLSLHPATGPSREGTMVLLLFHQGRGNGQCAGDHRALLVRSPLISGATVSELLLSHFAAPRRND